MRKLATGLTAAVAVSALVIGISTDADAQKKGSAQTCVNKGGTGTGSTDDSARFQAWEAVLQSIDWGSWGAWMTSSKTKIGEAPGYTVRNVKQKCVAGGGLGRQCTIFATLCK
ncbi:MAG TPA: hypothetical protein PK264_21085 [Hyphomicrobiaceae bacterium]|nr:hypothetical protein [Hyphomicrobiaceae bacterium]